jgi:formylmethanofuran dehydrogenase subunit C
MEAAMQRKKRGEISQVAALSRFGKYRPEVEKAVRGAEIVEDETLKQLFAAWKKFKSKIDTRVDYNNALALARSLEYSASDVEKFSIALVEFQDEYRFVSKAGLFLSALINNGMENDYTIHTGHLDRWPFHIGYLNTKNIAINGNAGHECGETMKSGSITVNGNSGYSCGGLMEDGSISVTGNARSGCGAGMKGGSIIVNGNTGANCGTSMVDGSITVNGNVRRECGVGMKGGIITVKGDAGGGIGHWMNGGIITVEGDAGGGIGELMEGGEIRIEGEIGSIVEYMNHGKIYHKGRLIVDK